MSENTKTETNAPRLTFPQLVEDLEHQSVVYRVNDQKVINLGGYREGELQIKWDGRNVSISHGNASGSLSRGDLVVLRAFLDDVLEGRLKEKFRLDLW